MVTLEKISWSRQKTLVGYVHICWRILTHTFQYKLTFLGWTQACCLDSLSYKSLPPLCVTFLAQSFRPIRINVRKSDNDSTCSFIVLSTIWMVLFDWQMTWHSIDTLLDQIEQIILLSKWANSGAEK